MADDKDKGVFDGFDFLASMLVRDDNNPGKPVKDVNDNILDIDPDELEKKIKDKGQKKDTTKKVDDDVDDVDDDQDDNDDNKTDDDKDENDEFEKDISSFFAAELAKKTGIELDEETKIESVDDVMSLLSTIIDDNSKPSYSSEEVERFDEFVKQGGDLREFYDQIYSGRINTEYIDIKKESDQKAVIKQHLLNQGYNEAKISRAISRYEESGVLEEEAEDALELVKEFDKKNAERLLKEQEEVFKEQQRMKQEFLRDVNSTMKDMTELAGVQISDKDKKELFSYIFATDRNGMTSFQRDIQKDVNTLIEVAFFTKNKDKVINKTKKKATSDAYKTLQEKIKMNKGKLGKSGGQINDDNSDKGSLGDLGKGFIF